MKIQRQIQVLLAACGAAAGAAAAQDNPYMINGSGATLLQALFRAPASTNDYIDVNNNSLIALDGDQLAVANPQPIGANPSWWIVTYRVVGSVNGFAELRDWGGPAIATAADLSPLNLTFNSSFSDQSLFNRTEFVNAGVTQGIFNPANPGATPTRQNLTTFRATTATGAGTGLAIDFAALDVPVAWSVIASGTPQYNRVPTAGGYGDNPQVPLNKDGTAVLETNKLELLVSPNGHTMNTNITSPDDKTIYDTLITLAPVAAMVNYGVGMSEIKMSDLRHLFATGRRINGENLVAVTRDSGSGTRNAFANGICLDPSWCAGENIGVRTVAAANDLLGPNFQPTNKGSSGRLEATVRNHRLAIGHSGVERGESAGWLTTGAADVLAVQSDLKGGTAFARPNLLNVISGSVDGYNITGPAVIATVGDPRANSANVGGWGWAPSEVGAYPNPVQPMKNAQAAAYLNNITRSIAAFVDVPAAAENLFTPGEYLATQFLLIASATYAPVQIFDGSETCVLPELNPLFNASLQNFIITESGNVLGIPNYQTFNFLNSAGRTPVRTAGVAYSDATAPGGSPTGQHYVDQSGNAVNYNVALPVSNRNRVSGDFNNDGVRTAADAAGMIAAWRQRHAAGPVWAPGTNAIIEMLGDFDGDGNFDADDIRYWADGLVLVNDMLNREVGFTAVDNAFGSNFFGTTLVTGAAYTPGASRADIAGPASLHTPGFAPIGHDGVVDMNDIDYIYQNFGNWMGTSIHTSLDDAVNMDLSADMNGDLIVDCEDIRVVVEDILGTVMGDVNLDGVYNSVDCAIIRANAGMTNVGYSGGDVNCDGIVNVYDLRCPVDLNCDGVLDFFDVQAFLQSFSGGSMFVDYNGDGRLDFFDVQAFLQLFSAGCN